MLPEDECKKWGAYMRSSPRSYSDKNTVWRLLQEAGAQGNPFGPTNPDWRIPAGIMDIHRLWLSLPYEPRAAFFARYVLRGEPGKRAKKVEMTKTAMYDESNKARAYMAGALSGVKVTSK